MVSRLLALNKAGRARRQFQDFETVFEETQNQQSALVYRLASPWTNMLVSSKTSLSSWSRAFCLER